MKKERGKDAENESVFPFVISSARKGEHSKMQEWGKDEEEEEEGAERREKRKEGRKDISYNSILGAWEDLFSLCVMYSVRRVVGGCVGVCVCRSVVFYWAREGDISGSPTQSPWVSQPLRYELSHNASIHVSYKSHGMFFCSMGCTVQSVSRSVS